MAIHTEVVPKSMKFTPTDDKGGTLTWKERVIRPGFRPVVKERTIRKDYFAAPDEGANHAAPMTEPEATVYGDSQQHEAKITDPETQALADQCGGATP